MEAEIFNTQEAILALCLTLAGCEPLNPQQPCINLFDSEILSKLGYKGLPIGEAAETAWKDQKKGHVEYILKRTPRLLDLVRAYRQQCVQIENLDMKASELITELLSNASAGIIQHDELILRIACVILKTRVQYVNLWKQMVPLIRVPNVGRTKNFDTTALSQGKVVEAKGVEKPGFTAISLNASEETRKHLGL